MSNTFANAEYRFGGWGTGSSQATSTGNYVDSNTLETRGGNVSPVSCGAGRIVAKPGYKVSVYFLTSQNTESITVSGSTRVVYVDVITSDPDYKKWDNVKIAPAGTRYACISVKKDSDAAFTQSEINNLYGVAFIFISNEELARAVYSAGGDMIVNQSNRYVQIDALKKQHPNYTDDQLLEEAILIARACGGATKILWDGSNVYFAGSVTHVCYGFGGIDFNGSKIVMPDYDTDFDVDYPPEIIRVLPDITDDVTASASDFTRYSTSNALLQDKVFTINDNYSGNAGMCLGNRIGFDTVIYYSPTMLTMPDGEFYTSHLYLVPSAGDVQCYNVHDYPAVTFEVSNGTVLTRNSQKMSCLVRCSRSNVHLHNFKLLGVRQNATTYHSRYLFSFKKCLDIEVDHIEGLNPIQTSSGYVLELSSVTNAHIHDCHIGDDTKWGVMGCNHLTNGFFERCDLNRWDCHYAQYGTQIIKECSLCWVGYGVGYGTFIIDNCTFIAKTMASISGLIGMRSDTVGVYDGNMIVKNCRFLAREQDVSKIIIWNDSNSNTKPQNSMLSGSPERNRIIENCEFPSGCYAIFRVGLSASADKSMYQNISYKVRDSAIFCTEGIFIPIASGQPIKEAALDGCTVGNCLTVKNLADCNVKVSNCNLVAVTSNVVLPRLSITGSAFSGDQSVSNFTAYALSGNIASDMASVNKHS